MAQSKKTRERAIEALMTCGSVTAAAQKAGLSRRTMYRLLDDDGFRKALVDARNQAFGLSMSRLCHLSGAAVTMLARVLAGLERDRLKFLAAVKVLELSSQSVAGDIETRFNELEDTLARLDAGQQGSDK